MENQISFINAVSIIVEKKMKYSVEMWKYKMQYILSLFLSSIHLVAFSNLLQLIYYDILMEHKTSCWYTYL